MAHHNHESAICAHFTLFRHCIFPVSVRPSNTHFIILLRVRVIYDLKIWDCFKETCVILCLLPLCCPCRRMASPVDLLQPSHIQTALQSACWSGCFCTCVFFLGNVYLCVPQAIAQTRAKIADKIAKAETGKKGKKPAASTAGTRYPAQMSVQQTWAIEQAQKMRPPNSRIWRSTLNARRRIFLWGPLEEKHKLGIGKPGKSH